MDASSDEGLTPVDLLGNIVLKNVNFRYPARTEVQVCFRFGSSLYYIYGSIVFSGWPSTAMGD